MLIVLFLVLAPRAGFSEATLVPSELQVQLLSRVCQYDRNFQARAGDTVRVLILVKEGSTRSDVSASSLKAAFSGLDRLAGLPHRETVVTYDTAAALAKRCIAERISVVYLTSDLAREIEAIRAALDSVNVLTVAMVPEYVPSGIILGFELLSGKPKMLLNLQQARRQNVSFPALVMSLMKVVAK